MIYMKNLLIFSSPGIWPMLEYEIDIIQRAIDENYNITYLQCKGGLNSCIANKENSSDLFNPLKCIRCKSRTYNGLKLVTDKSRINVVEFPFINESIKRIEKKLKFQFNQPCLDLKKIKEIVDIEDIDIFDSGISTLMSTLKDSHPDLHFHKKLFYNYLIEGIYSLFTFKKLLGNSNFEKVIIFNGRISRYRPALRLAQKLKLNVFLLEYPEFDFSSYSLTPKKYSHDFNHRSLLLRAKADEENSCSKESKLDIGQKIIEDSLNQNSVHGIFINPEYVKLQHKNLLPKSWDKSKYNIVFFTSSDFEMAGVPEYLNQLPEGSQAGAIKRTRELLSKKEFNITVRVHPNQKNQDLTAAKILYNLEGDGLNIIHATSSVDSYALAKETDIVITFGSQLSVESAYLGKYVIVLGGNMYSSFKFCKTCYSIENAVQVIHNIRKNIKTDFHPYKTRIEEACMHMYARKNIGVPSQYLYRDTYIGGEIKIKDQQIQILDSKFMHFITKYLGLPFLLVNEYRKNGIQNLIQLLVK
jgi:hypothetical protein